MENIGLPFEWPPLSVTRQPDYLGLKRAVNKVLGEVADAGAVD